MKITITWLYIHPVVQISALLDTSRINEKCVLI